MMNRKLQVGLLMDSLEVPAWVYKMLARIQDSEYAEISLIILNNSDQQATRGLITKIKANWHNLLYIAYRSLDNKFFKPQPPAFEPRKVTDLLVDVPVLKVKPLQKKYSDWIEDQDIETIQKYDLDILVRLGFRILRGKILKIAKYGIWSYHHGDNEVNRGGPPGFWEVLEGHPVTGSILQILTDDLDNGQVLYRSYSATDRLSVNRNLNNYYWKSMSFLPRKLQELHQSGREKFLSRVMKENGKPYIYTHPLYTTPSNMEFLKAAAGHLYRFIKYRLNDLFLIDQWILLYDMRDSLSGSIWRYKKIIPPKDRFWADPFVLYRDQQYYVFVEELDYKTNKGHIAFLVIDEKGKFSTSKKIIEQPYHLSYPFVFEWNGDTYMIPDSSENRTIDVYRCVEFPERWEFYKTLMNNIWAVDTTLFYDQQKWWMFTNIKENEGASSWDELFLFSSDSPLSTHWTPHPGNPIVSDVRRSRPAGRIFNYNGSLYRPSQDSSRGYGYGIRIHCITCLNEYEYREEEAQFIEPDWEKNIRGIHTFNSAHQMTIVDANYPRRRFS